MTHQKRSTLKIQRGSNSPELYTFPENISIEPIMAGDDYNLVKQKLYKLLSNQGLSYDDETRSHLQRLVIQLVDEVDRQRKNRTGIPLFDDRKLRDTQHLLISVFHAIHQPTKIHLQALAKETQHWKKSRKITSILMRIGGAIVFGAGLVGFIYAGPFATAGGTFAALCLFGAAYHIKGKRRKFIAGEIENIVKPSKKLR